MTKLVLAFYSDSALQHFLSLLGNHRSQSCEGMIQRSCIFLLLWSRANQSHETLANLSGKGNSQGTHWLLSLQQKGYHNCQFASTAMAKPVICFMLTPEASKIDNQSKDIKGANQGQEARSQSVPPSNKRKPSLAFPFILTVFCAYSATNPKLADQCQFGVRLPQSSICCNWQCPLWNATYNSA